jgi:hapalindole H/12-epi-hapalindole U/12-epi-fischerindole U synthase
MKIPFSRPLRALPLSLWPRCIFTAGLVLPTVTVAALLPVSNPGFENPVTAPGVFTGAQAAGPVGWTVYNRGATNSLRFFGVWNPATTASFADPVPDGANVGVVFLDNTTAIAEAGLQQVLAATLQLATRYTLTVEVGNFAPSAGAPWNFTGFPGYRVDLLAGSAVIASDNNTLQPGEGRFLTATVGVSIGASHANAGQPLTIRLVSLNGPGVEVNFDRVRLDATAVPEPPSPAAGPTRLSNLSILTALATRGENFALGFVVGGAGTGGPKPLVIRAAGPSLGAFGIGGLLDDPLLEFFSGPTKTGENDNWGGADDEWLG